MAVATLTDAKFHPTCFVYEPIVFSGDERFGNSLRPPLSWLGVSVVAITVGFRPQLYAITTIVAGIRPTARLCLVVDVTLTP